jgi:transposase
MLVAQALTEGCEIVKHSDIIICGCCPGRYSGDMRPITLLDPENSRVVLQQEINRHQDARYDHRLHCVSLVASGMSCEQVAAFFGDSPRSVVNWVRRFDQKGLAGLAEGNHSGRPSNLSAEQMEEVRALIRKSPTEAGLSANFWDGKTLAACLQARYQIQLGVRQCQRLFHQLEMRHRLPRPAVGKADPQRQAGHKKNSRHGRKTQP